MKAHRKVSGLICSPGGSESAAEFLLLWSLDRFKNKDLKFCDADDAINHTRTFQRFSHVFVAPPPAPQPPTHPRVQVAGKVPLFWECTLSARGGAEMSETSRAGSSLFSCLIVLGLRLSIRDLLGIRWESNNPPPVFIDSS